MLVRTSPPPPRNGVARRRRGIAALALGAVAVTGLAAPSGAADLPEQEPGVTLRTFQLASDPGAVCTLKSGQTPNVDKLMPTIDWTTAEQFGAEDRFISQVTANLTVETAGQYTFRVTNDDGAIVYIDDQQVIENDGPNDSTSVEGNATLTAGVHALRVDYYEGGDKQRLTLAWKTPGSSTFEVVPQSVLSTEADVVRVTAPGYKYCEGDTDTAGDGLRLDTVNPNYELTDLRPEGFEPKVSGLAFTPDEKLAVVTTGEVSSGGWRPDPVSGEVYFLDGVVDADGPEDVTVTKVADELLNPMGIEVIEDSIFVSERYQLTQLTDPDGDGFYDVHTKIAEWPDGGNFHEFAFGLVHDEDYFYVNLSVAIDNGGATTNPQPAQNRGTSIKIDRETGEVTYVAGGLRTPNGIGFGPEGELFATDNQGAWLPSNKLVHIEQDRFFNHFTNPAGPFDTNPVTPPAVWLPQNEIANSPGNPILVEEGEFAGQMLLGDVTYGGIQRAFLEKVDGEFQGAVFRHTAGLEVGVNRVLTGPDGALYVGGTGEGGNWGESGKLRFGLQKLTPVNEDSFDMKEMRVVEGGFEIEYTDPVSDEVVANLADAYQLKQWRYVPTQQYGGPKVDEQPVFVTDAQVSEDRTTVTLQVDGLKPGHVVHLRSPRPFASAEGTELLSTEAWYTLNSLPGYVAPADRGWYEAETAQPLGGSSIAADHSNYSGTGFAAGMTNVGSGRTFTVTVDEAGTYPVNVRYANGIHPYTELRAKNVSLHVNGEDLGQWNFPTTGDWKNWGTQTRDLELQAGTNTITLRYEDGDEGNVNLDVLSVGETPDICTPGEVEEGYTALFDGTLASLDAGWRMAGPGGFGRQDDCSIRGEGGMGLLWYTAEELGEYSLKLDWKLSKDDNGGVFVGFPNPGNDPWVAVNQGYEIQIDATDADDRTTGAVYTFQGADLDAVDEALNPVGQWNAYDIRVEGDRIRIYLNDVLVNDFTSTDPARDLSSGFVGIQNHGGGEMVSYRNIRVKDLAGAEDLAVDATAQVRCLAGKTYVAVRATNADTVPADITLTTPFGTKTVTGVQPGASAYQSFATRATSVEAGAAQVSASGDGRTAQLDVAYDAASCG
ncbi:family 16 glycoside hydrolase [Cellulosimicrobium sp. Marseille-Q4280]|uniref:family 16 glycoside hydrolase n=1 Tax=Cellulosimicrobium sp. Marseille-Q4280 TaxID=2937992 RepID=UPI00203DF87C|nr:family 16 glycoside hydrolase [Cellulosimicrobium sp. Marseille-Q4280]